MNNSFYLVKACRALRIKNNFNGMSKFSTLKIPALLARIHFFDFGICSTFLYLLFFISIISLTFSAPVLRISVSLANHLGCFQLKNELGSKFTEFLDELSIEIGKFKKYLYIIYWLGFKPITYDLDLLFFYSHTLLRDNIAQGLPLILL